MKAFRFSFMVALAILLFFGARGAYACGNGVPPAPHDVNFRAFGSTTVGEITSTTPGVINSIGGEYIYKYSDNAACTCGGLAQTDVKWAYSDEEVRKAAPARNQAFAIYFCSERVARLAGEGSKAFDDFKKANAGVPPPVTLFDYSLTQNQFTMAGIELLLKVPDVKEYAAVFKKYDAIAGTLMVCAPDGERLATFVGGDCNATTVVGFLNNDFDKKMEAWMRSKRSAEDLAAWKKTQEARRKAAGGISPILDSRLQNAFHFGSKIITGGFPVDDAAFQALKELGVKTIIRVDGEPPATERADKLGMTYLHVPVSYAGIPHDKAMQLAKLVRDMPGPVYIHCNCGRHRSPAAAAVILGEMTPQQATSAMWVAGTFTDYTGLYASAENETKQSNEALDAVNAVLTAKADTSPMTLAMGDIDKSWKKIEALQHAKWKLADGARAGDVENELKHAIDRFLEADSWEQLKKAPKASAMVSSAQTELAQMMKDWRAGHDTAEDHQRLDASLLRVQQSCYNCHGEYRNAMAPAKK